MKSAARDACSGLREGAVSRRKRVLFRAVGTTEIRGHVLGDEEGQETVFPLDEVDELEIFVPGAKDDGTGVAIGVGIGLVLVIGAAIAVGFALDGAEFGGP